MVNQANLPIRHNFNQQASHLGTLVSAFFGCPEVALSTGGTTHNPLPVKQGKSSSSSDELLHFLMVFDMNLRQGSQLKVPNFFACNMNA